MSLIVQKFGGSSLANREKLLRAAQIVKDARCQGHDIVVVVSAQGDTTDILLQKAQELTEKPSVRELDALLSTGEQASAALLALALQSIEVNAVSLCAWQLPLLTDPTYGSAKVEGIGINRLEAERKDGSVAVVTGFQGVNENADTTTLGRGGSDLSAVALAAALNADALQIYTDVDGIYTADPRICPNARHVDRISYDEMLALARCGAQVLHDRSVALAQKYGVAIEVLSCREGSAKSIVCTDAPKCEIAGITKRESNLSKLCAVSVVGKSLPSTEQENRAVKALERADITVCAIGEGEGMMTFYILRADGEKAVRILHESLIEQQ